MMKRLSRFGRADIAGDFHRNGTCDDVTDVEPKARAPGLVKAGLEAHFSVGIGFRLAIVECRRRARDLGVALDLIALVAAR